MKAPQPIKLIARNAPAIRKTQAVNSQPRLNAGNPISSRLESGIGNCFPGLECDLRNLERRFFPFLTVDILTRNDVSTITLESVDMKGVRAAKAKGTINAQTYAAYRALTKKGDWTVESMKGTFGPLGTLQFKLTDLGGTSTGAGRLPIDGWTAVRLLSEGTDVYLIWHKSDPAVHVAISAKRARYLNDDGALADIFAPGELTQSLCSPWTHDFRDCGCFYWASNHPDIALPPLPTVASADPKWNIPVPWERSVRDIDVLPAHATREDPEPFEMKYFEINKRWQKLNFVVEGREQTGPYAQQAFFGKPLVGDALKTHLLYATGVELAVLQEYLAAAYSLKPKEELSGHLHDDVRATNAELMRIALGEMRHIRAANYVLASVMGAQYEPALGVATEIPGGTFGEKIPVEPMAFTPKAMKRFLAIEAPSESVSSKSVDGVYADILATLNQRKALEEIQAVRTIMAEGEDHYQTFRAIQEWLAPYKPKEYLRKVNPKPAPKGNPFDQALQREYKSLLEQLYRGYEAGLPDGAPDLNAARLAMVSKLAGAIEAVAKAGFLVVFDTPKDPRFKPVAPPT